MAAMARRLYTARRMLRIASLLLFLCAASSHGAEIRLWHSMKGVRGAAFERLVARFNAEQASHLPRYRVVATYKGAYDEAAVEAVTARRKPRAPHIVQAS